MARFSAMVLTLAVLPGILPRMETESQNNYYARRQHFKRYLKGDGVEVGALHNPLDTLRSADYPHPVRGSL